MFADADHATKISFRAFYGFQTISNAPSPAESSEPTLPLGNVFVHANRYNLAWV